MKRYFIIFILILIQLFGSSIFAIQKTNKLILNLDNDYMINITLSPNGKMIATGGFNGNIKLWDIATGQLKGELATNEWINKVQFSPDNQSLVSIGYKNIKQWSLISKKVKSTFQNKGYDFVDYSPNGKLLVLSGTFNQTVMLVNTKKNTEQKKITINHNIKKIKFIPQSTLLIINDVDNNIHLLDTQTGKLIASKKFSAIKKIISKNKHQLFILTDKSVYSWDIKTNQISQLTDGNYQEMISKNNYLILSQDTTVYFFDINTKKIKQTYHSLHTAEIFKLIYIPKRKLLLSSSKNELKIWDLSQKAQLIATLDVASKIKQADYIPSLKKIIILGENKIDIWEANTKVLQQLMLNELENLSDKIEKEKNRIVTQITNIKQKIIDFDNQIKKLYEGNCYGLKEWFHQLSLYTENTDTGILSQLEVALADLKQSSNNHLHRYLQLRLKIIPELKVLQSILKNKIASLAQLQTNIKAIKPSDRGLLRENFNILIQKNKRTNLKMLAILSKIRSIYTIANQNTLKSIYSYSGCSSVVTVTSASASASVFQDPWLDNGFGIQVPNANGMIDTQHIPLSNKNTPLPHNGLFTRRNNQFGTKINTGIKQYIEQGVMIDQHKIRFDDFIALNSKTLPAPLHNHALAVSYGLTKIPSNQKTHGKATHYLEIALKTAETAPLSHPEIKPPAVNYIFVVDVSGSMSGEKIDSVKVSIKKLFDKLQDEDVIGLITFDEQAKTVFTATPKKDINREKFNQVIRNIQSNGGTDLNLGLSFGISEIKRYSDGQRLNQVFLFSDGNPSSGENNWIKIRSNIAKKTRNDIILSTFAYGSDANKQELDKLAGLTGGQNIIVNEADDVTQSLEENLIHRDHLAAMNIQMQIKIDQAVAIHYFYGHDHISDPVQRKAIIQQLAITKQKATEKFGIDAPQDLITEEEGIRIFVPNLAIGETYWVVLELELPKEFEHKAIGNATIQYLDTFARKNEKNTFDLTPHGQILPPTVILHALGLRTSEEIFYAMDDLYSDDLDTAEKRIETHISLLEGAKISLKQQQPTTFKRIVNKITDDIITLGKFLNLARNLGKTSNLSDSQRIRGYTLFHLNKFSKVQNGYQRVQFKP